MTARPKPDPAAVLAERVFAGGESKPFAEVTIQDVMARATELKEASGWGPTARVAAVARAWAELGETMRSAGAHTVGDLPSQELAERAERLWVVPPGGSLL